MALPEHEPVCRACEEEMRSSHTDMIGVALQAPARAHNATQPERLSARRKRGGGGRQNVD